MSSDVNGKTREELEKSGHYVGIMTEDIMDRWGHGTGSYMNPNTGKAEPKPKN